MDPIKEVRNPGAYQNITVLASYWISQCYTLGSSITHHFKCFLQILLKIGSISFSTIFHNLIKCKKKKFMYFNPAFLLLCLLRAKINVQRYPIKILFAIVKTELGAFKEKGKP